MEYEDNTGPPLSALGSDYDTEEVDEDEDNGTDEDGGEGEDGQFIPLGRYLAPVALALCTLLLTITGQGRRQRR